MKSTTYETVEERFFAKVDVGDCWEWTAGTSSGYGRFRLDGHTVYAHRWIWEHLVGRIPSGLQIDHLCRNRRCVNPDHLEPVTHAENIKRGTASAIRAAVTHCVNGHEYTAASTGIKSPQGTRFCKTCKNDGARRRRVAPAKS